MRWRKDVWALLTGVMVAVACIAMVWGGSLSRSERAVFLWVNGLPDWLEAPLWAVQLVGSLAFVLGVALMALLFKRTRLAIALTAAIPTKLAVEWLVVKRLVERERPSLTVAEAIVREENSSALGFPSGHAILVFAVVTLVTPYVGRRFRWSLFAVAALAAFARVYLAAHNPLDVVAGAGLGVALGSVLNVVVGMSPSDGLEPRNGATRE